jgi:pantoate--beta-alanine ligase
MKLIRDLQKLRSEIKSFRRNAPFGSIGFIPTMGFLHEGHVSLIRAARLENQLVVVSLFVNPAQFGPKEDFSKYPRNESRDAEMCEAAGCDILFAPAASDIYPDGHRTAVSVRELSDPLCGRFRPGHFEGVATIVAKLFNMVAPDIAYFGQKDAQQCVVLERMTQDLNFDIQIKIMPTVREPDGLAMSSRNVYLSAAGRAKAPLLYQALSSAKKTFSAGERRVRPLIDAAIDRVKSDPAFTLQYLECLSIRDLKPVEIIEQPVLIALAAFLESVRLIDNIILIPDPNEASK